MNSSLITALNEFGEDDFTENILKPLFESMGYDRVEFNGGPNEKGRDLIALKKNPPRPGYELTLVQSKLFKERSATKESEKLTKLYGQIQQCLHNPHTTESGQKIKASTVIIASPNCVSTRVREAIEGLIEANLDKIYIYDAPDVIRDIKDYCPKLLSKLTSLSSKIVKTENEELTNIELHSALKVESQKSYSQYYCDLQFFVGSISSNLLLNLSMSEKSESEALSTNEWNALKERQSFYQSTFNLSILNEFPDEIDKWFDHELSRYQDKNNLDNIDEVKRLQKAASSALRDNTVRQKKLKNTIERIYSGKVPKPFEEEDFYSYVNFVIQAIENRSEASDFIYPSKAKEYDEFLSNDTKSALEDIKNYHEYVRQHQIISRKIIPRPRLNISIDFESISEKVKGIQEFYRGSIEALNSGSIKNSDLKRFLEEIEKSLSLAKNLISDKIVCRYIKFDFGKLNYDKLSISPHSIFDTGVDIALYGGAGAGKTTTLQTYADSYSGSESKVVFYLPLNRLSQKIQKDIFSSLSSGNSEEGGLDDAFSNMFKGNQEKIKDLIIKFLLISKKEIPSEENVILVKKKMPSNSVVVLDGLDEVFSKYPYISEAITEFKKEFKHVQLIASSRDCVKEIKDIDLLGITLLPFSEHQLYEFILGWMDSEKKAEKLLTHVKNHQLYEFINTPLLATIACSLAEKGIEIPSVEHGIYADRLSLLTGEYDSHKKVDRQTQKPSSLRYCAQKIAMKLHQGFSRSTTKAQLLEWLQSPAIKNSMPAGSPQKCLEELIDPCDLLKVDPLNDQVGFGHFRYQEHLVALELEKDRSIAIEQLLNSPWWQGALSLYAQNNDIMHLFESAFNSDFVEFSDAVFTLKKMIDSSPRNRQNEYNELLKNYENLADSSISSIYDDYDYDDVMAIREYFDLT